VVTETNQEFEDLRRRFELAVEDVRELKNKNSELTDQLARAKAAPGGGGVGHAMDWESQKRRMLEQLDSDFDDNNDQDKANKLSIEEAIKSTERAVAEKDREIEELRRHLESQSKNVGEVAVGASAIAAALDSDAIIRQERESLQQLQAKLREELKKAEVDCSLERAKVARERSELEEKMRQFASEKASIGHVEPGVGGADKNKKGSGGGGKWLARLGLGADKGK
jgi:DNA repair exonuclease SbcCD ATPase subunit